MKTFTKSFFIFHFSFFIFQLNGEAQIIHVPADYATIQLGINAASPGDTVVVADGLYFENIDFLGKKPLVIASHYMLDGDTNHINNTIIDGSQSDDIDKASVVSFKSGEDTTSILYGFTIRGGKGTWDAANNNRCGGGIYISGSGAKIIHNKITENTVDDTQAGNGQETYGGGIGTSHEDADYWIIIENNQIYNNSAVTKYGWSAGGGIYDSYNARIANNVIFENSSFATTNGWGSGGGFSHVDLDNGDANTLIILNNIFHHNTAESVSGLGLEGAACTVNSHLTFVGNEVLNNHGITPLGQGGGMGGLSIIDPAEDCIVSGNIFRDNLGTFDGGALIMENFSQVTNPNQVIISDNYFLNNQGTYGGAVRENDIPAIFQNNVFHGNQASQRGGAIYMVKSITYSFDHLATFINNSFSGNTAENYGGAIYANKAKPLLLNSIFYNNSAGMDGPEIYLNHYLDTVDIAYCNINQALIYGNTSDLGDNISEDPGFLDDTCHIDEFSPCVDKGADSIQCDGVWYFAPETDFDGTPRPWNLGIDMGADECDIFAGIPIKSAVGSRQSAVSVYPNPTQGIVDIRFTVYDLLSISLKIYNAQGQEVATALDEKCAGDNVVRWDMSGLPAGIYYYQLRAEGEGQVSAGEIVKY